MGNTRNASPSASFGPPAPRAGSDRARDGADPDDAATLYPDSAIRAALSSVAIRASVPVEEQLGLLPFRVGDLAQFRIGGVIRGARSC